MRFLHTGDWHIGKTLRTRSRLDEFEAALDEVARIAMEARVDAVLVAGDVFDSPAPPPEAERLVYDFLARLLPERVACVLIAGNHDHPRKLGALARLLEGLRIHVRSEVRPPSQGGVVGVPSRDGREEARVAVLPFVPERKVVDACQVMEQGVDGILMNTALAEADDPVAMAHAMRHTTEAGRLAFLAGRMPRREIAVPSSPTRGMLE